MSGSPEEEAEVGVTAAMARAYPDPVERAHPPRVAWPQGSEDSDAYPLYESSCPFSACSGCRRTWSSRRRTRNRRLPLCEPVPTFSDDFATTSSSGSSTFSPRLRGTLLATPRSKAAAFESREGSDGVAARILVLALVILAIAGGVALSKFLWLVLIIALIVALVALLSGRRTA